MTDPRKSRTYQKLRAKFLATRPAICYWCAQPVMESLPRNHPRKATVDHLVEVDAAPALALDTTTWVVACHSCNSKRGTAYRNRRDRKTEQRTPSRNW